MASSEPDIPLYSATYSSVPVYELLISNGGSIMRRKSDDWVNATHILKAADFAKAKRTRILEREVQGGEHEKVQGGYGKYQGTWIPLSAAQDLAKRFEVYSSLSPILNEIDFDPPLVPKFSRASKNKDASAVLAGATLKTSLIKLKKKSEKGQKAVKSLSVPSNNETSSVEPVPKKSVTRSASIATKLPSITDSILEKPLVTKITISKESQNSMSELQTRKRGRPRRSEVATRTQERKQQQILPASKENSKSNSDSPTLTSAALLHKILPKSGKSNAKALRKYQSTPSMLAKSFNSRHGEGSDLNILQSHSVYEDDADTATDDDIENDIEVHSHLPVLQTFNDDENNLQENTYYEEDNVGTNETNNRETVLQNNARSFSVENLDANNDLEEIEEPPKKKKRGRKPKNDPNLALTTPVKINKTTMEYNVLKSFANEKSSPLNEKELDNYLRQNTKRNKTGNLAPDSIKDLSRIDEEEDIYRINQVEASNEILKENNKANTDDVNSNKNNDKFKTFDPSSSPSVFMSDHDLAKALKSPSLKRNDSIEIKRKKADKIVETVSENNLEKQHNGPSNSSVSNLGTPALRSGSLRTNVDSEWLADNDEFTKKLVTYLMRSGSREDNHYFTKMSGASDSHNEGVPEFLLHLPANFQINKHIDPDGNTALHWACALGRLPIVEYLLKKCGANSKCMNNKGLNPLMRTVKYNNSYTNRIFSKTVELLKDSIFETDSKKRSVLHHIALSSNSPSKSNSSRYYTEILLSKVLDLYNEAKVKWFVNLQDNKGNTAIYYAISNNAKKCVKVLLGHHAILNIKNERGETSIDLLDRNAVLLGNSTPSTAGTPMTNKSAGFGNSRPGSQNGDINNSGNNHSNNYSNNMNAFTPQMKPMRAGPSRASLSFTPPLSGAGGGASSGGPGSLAIQRELACSSENRKLVETTEKSLIKSFNDVVTIYNDELVRKNKLVENLENCKLELEEKINLIEKNIVSSSMAVNQNGGSKLGSDDVDEEEVSTTGNADTTSLATSIIKTGNSKLEKKAAKQEKILNTKIQQLEDLLNLIQKVNLSKMEKEKKNEQDAANEDNKEDAEFKGDDEKVKVAYCIEICKLQSLRDYKTKQILSNFISDQNGNVLGQFESDWKITQEKINRMNLYRRLVAACCDIGINEVDDLIDVIYKSLVKSEN